MMEQDQDDRNPPPSSEVEQAIMACVNELRESPTRWSSVAAMAAHYHYSADHFSRAFKQRLGLSPAQFLIEVRLEHARNLLRYTNLSASQIAQELGFADPAYFSRVFTRHHRISPGAWRRQGG
ncbi:MAG: AraC family transcriptional regulator [Planctomycetota bacterium]|nr:MAG: AraC family transcriptional regulator [Planctomycetota bacterium]